MSTFFHPKSFKMHLFCVNTWQKSGHLMWNTQCGGLGFRGASFQDSSFWCIIRHFSVENQRFFNRKSMENHHFKYKYSPGPSRASLARGNPSCFIIKSTFFVIKSTFFNRKSGFLSRKSGFFRWKLTCRQRPWRLPLTSWLLLPISH